MAQEGLPEKELGAWLFFLLGLAMRRRSRLLQPERVRDWIKTSVMKELTFCKLSRIVKLMISVALGQ